MAVTLTKEQAFWAQLDLAQRNRRLYKTWHDWLHFLLVTPYWELHAGLKDYFGCSEKIEVLWIDYKRAIDLHLPSEVVQSRLETAIKETWEEPGGMPARFEWLMGPEFWEEPCTTL